MDKQNIRSIVAQTQSLPRLITADELSQRTTVHAQRLIELAEAGYLPHWRIDGGPPMFAAAEARAWIAKNLIARNRGQALPVNIVVTSPRPLLTATELPPALRGLASLEDITNLIFSAESGIYFLCLDGEVVYVGQSKQVAIRIQSHVGKKLFDRVLFMRWPASDLDRMEGALIRALKPRLNFTRIGYLSAPRPTAMDDTATLQEIFNELEEVHA